MPDYPDLNLYTVWGPNGLADTLVPGPGPPRFADGRLQNEGAELVWHILAASWEDAMTIYHEKQGWEAYRP